MPSRGARRRWRPAGWSRALAAAGPLVDPALRTSPFTGHNDYVGFFGRRAALRGEPPRFYATLARRRDAPVLEFPWVPFWSHTQSYYLYQEVHRQDVLLAMAQPLRGHRRLRLRNMPSPSPEAFLASRARYLVVHLDLPAEEVRVEPHCRPLVPRMRDRHRRLLVGAGRKTARRLTALWGEPDRRERGIAVWDLDRVRRDGSARRPWNGARVSVMNEWGV